MTRTLALFVAVAVALSGCSFVLVHAPTTPEPEPQHWPHCTEHYFWEAVDATVLALALAGLYTTYHSDDDYADLGVGVFGLMSVGFGTSAVVGLGRTGRCRDARAAYERAALEGR